MTNSALMPVAVNLVEKGRVPDALSRAGIRRLLRRRLEDEQLYFVEAEFVARCRDAPIARLPDKANEQHYELPPEFFQMVLGQHRKYSCCEWAPGVTTLDDAEASALTTVCKRAGIADGMNVLDLGCGWGSFTLWALDHYPDLQITAVSNSSPQREFINRQAAGLGVESRLQLITADINDFDAPATYDRVVSIEMLEHVTNHDRLFKRISQWLCPNGKLFIHIFCHRDLAYFFEPRGPGDWMAEHFFSGGMMPSASLFANYNDHLQISKQWRVNGTHYQRTCNAWLEQMTSRRAEILPILERTYGNEASRWYHRWRLFFMSCAELFGFNAGEEWFVCHYLLEA